MSLWDDMQARDAAAAEAIQNILAERIEAVVAAHDFGAASAAKRGRNPRYPYVPVIKIRSDGSQMSGYGSARTRQLKGLAYPTRDEALARAQQQIDATKRQFALDLCRPRNRALREQHGLPREPLEQ